MPRLTNRDKTLLRNDYINDVPDVELMKKYNLTVSALKYWTRRFKKMGLYPEPKQMTESSILEVPEELPEVKKSTEVKPKKEYEYKCTCGYEFDGQIEKCQNCGGVFEWQN